MLACLLASVVGLTIPPMVPMVHRAVAPAPAFLPAQVSPIFPSASAFLFPSSLIALTDCEGNELPPAGKLSPECAQQKKVQALRASQKETERIAAEKLETLLALEAQQEAGAAAKAERAAKRVAQEAEAQAKAVKAYQTRADREAVAVPVEPTCIYCAPSL